MLLAVDIGNTNIVVGVFADASLTAHFRIQTVYDRMADEYHVTLAGLFRESGIDATVCESVVVSSVVPVLTEAVAEALHRLTGRVALVLSPTAALNVTIAIGNPRELGSDLIANAVAAYDRFRDACIVVDFGTALTFTAVSAKGAILGAAIAPGLRTAVHSLAAGTAQLPEIDLNEPESAIGTDTPSALRAGIVLGYQGLVNEVIRQMKQQIGVPTRVIATGGLSGAMAARLAEIDAVDPWLTLEGLRIVAELNRG